MSLSFFDVIPDYLQNDKYKETLERCMTTTRLVDKALHVLMQEEERPLLVAETFTRNWSSDKEYAVYLFFTDIRVYSIYLSRGFTRKVKVESGILEYPDIQLKEKGVIFKKMHIVGKYRKVDDPPDKRRRIIHGLRLPHDALVTEVTRVMQVHHGAPTMSSIEGRMTSATQDGPRQASVKLLEDLQRLRDSGVLSEEEFKQKKIEILSRL